MVTQHLQSYVAILNRFTTYSLPLLGSPKPRYLSFRLLLHHPVLTLLLTTNPTLPNYQSKWPGRPMTWPWYACILFLRRNPAAWLVVCAPQHILVCSVRAGPVGRPFMGFHLPDGTVERLYYLLIRVFQVDFCLFGSIGLLRPVLWFV